MFSLAFLFLCAGMALEFYLERKNNKGNGDAANEQTSTHNPCTTNQHTKQRSLTWRSLLAGLRQHSYLALAISGLCFIVWGLE